MPLWEDSAYEDFSGTDLKSCRCPKPAFKLITLKIISLCFFLKTTMFFLRLPQQQSNLSQQPGFSSIVPSLPHLTQIRGCERYSAPQLVQIKCKIFGTSASTG